MDCLGSLGAEVARCSCPILGHQVCYIISYRKIIRDLNVKKGDLENIKNGVEQRVVKARGDPIADVTTSWLNNANNLINGTELLNEEAKGIDSCFKGWCCARYCLGRKATHMIRDVTELMNDAKDLGDVSVPVSLQDIEMTSTGDFEAFNSRESAFSEVKKALGDNQISLIGVHGGGGIGKTTLIKKIGSEVKTKKLFDVVVMVAISQSPDVKRIQDEIAGELSLNFGQEGADSRAKRLCARLNTEKSVLIILDDIWNELDLAAVGIPYGEDHKGCKVVLTTRRLDVCNVMNTQKNIELEFLSETDSWDLFRKNAGTEVNSPNLIDVAKKVAKECKGLPVALVTLGRAMRNKDKSLWDDVLQQLMESNFSHIEGMDGKVFKAIKLSYDYLQHEDTKFIFLFCTLFPEDYKISIDDLVRYMIGEGITRDANIDRSKGILNTAVNHLTSSHLLQKSDESGCVLMHDIIRDVAINIATSDKGFIVRAGRGLGGWPENEVLRNCKRLSLMENELSQLPGRPECPELLTLALSGCKNLNHIPDDFFKEMKCLVNLDLSYTPISSLPLSLECLKNLRSLCLDGCSRLEDASLIGKLTTLEVISLKNTSIKNLPYNEIVNFPNRKLLKLKT